jgi:hypothetical protein
MGRRRRLEPFAGVCTQSWVDASPSSGLEATYLRARAPMRWRALGFFEFSSLSILLRVVVEQDLFLSAHRQCGVRGSTSTTAPTL